MSLQLGLPAALARRGLTVEVVPGWETRSAGSFNPKGALCHWTAGPKGTLKRPSLAICTHGRADLPGPLCNVYLDRRGVAVVVAAGRANHAGAGSWRGVTGNSSLFGTECEAGGPDDFTAEQRWAYPRVNAAFCDLGGFGAEMVAGHSEYATPRGRKVDINGYTMADMRADVASVLAGQTPTSPLQEDDMAAVPQHQWDEVYALIRSMPINVGNDLIGGPVADVTGGPQQQRAVIAGIFARSEATLQLAGAFANRSDVDEVALGQSIATSLLPAVLLALGDAKGIDRADVEAAVRSVLASAVAAGPTG